MRDNNLLWTSSITPTHNQVVHGCGYVNLLKCASLKSPSCTCELNTQLVISRIIFGFEDNGISKTTCVFP